MEGGSLRWVLPNDQRVRCVPHPTLPVAQERAAEVISRSTARRRERQITAGSSRVNHPHPLQRALARLEGQGAVRSEPAHRQGRSQPDAPLPLHRACSCAVCAAKRKVSNCRPNRAGTPSVVAHQGSLVLRGAPYPGLASRAGRRPRAIDAVRILSRI